jgi:hypothetical protein
MKPIRLALVALGLSVLAGVAGCGPVSFGCTVKIVGADASVTVSGPLAGQTCEKIMSNQFFLDPSWASTQWFQPTETPREPQMCIYEISGQKFVVRDQGLFKILGNLLCEALRKQAG